MTGNLHCYYANSWGYSQNPRNWNFSHDGVYGCGPQVVENVMWSILVYHENPGYLHYSPYLCRWVHVSEDPLYDGPHLFWWDVGYQIKYRLESSNRNWFRTLVEQNRCTWTSLGGMFPEGMMRTLGLDSRDWNLLRERCLESTTNTTTQPRQMPST